MSLASGPRGWIHVAVIGGVLALIGAVRPAVAVDGVIEINQARALAGGVTPGDAPGFPVTISLSGSYRLTSNLDVRVAADPKNTTAIFIDPSAANNVNLDLNGFSIIGPTTCSFCHYNGPVSCSPAGTGVGIDGGHFYSTDITITNGHVKGMGGGGVVTISARVDNVRATSNGGVGIAGGTVSGSTAVANAGVGIEATIVTGSSAEYNGTTGILAGQVANSEASNNCGDGISSAFESLVTASTASFNLGDGIVGTLVIGSMAQKNEGFGLRINCPGGYANNVLLGNTGGTVTGGVQMATNVCNGGTCP